VLGLPGHSPDSIALVDRAAGLLWSGDTFYEGQIWLVREGAVAPKARQEGLVEYPFDGFSFLTRRPGPAS
jgi:glyoxylase-like metal-dependent hydrolase (beta-lactamase superfamily II)